MTQVTSDIGGGSERFVPEASTFSHTAEQHVGRYEWACRQLRGANRVLDVACGAGYGSHMLRTGLNCTVVGSDISPVAVNHASKTYGCDGLEFVQDDAQVLAHMQEHEFDAAVSFETIEHVQDPASFVRSLHRVLQPGGRLLISTPDRRLYSVLYPITGRPHHPHHLREFTLREFIDVMGEKFIVDEIFGQSFVPAALVAWPIQILLKGLGHKVLGRIGKKFIERTYWRGTGTDVQLADSNKGRISNCIILSCIAN